MTDDGRKNPPLGPAGERVMGAVRRLRTAADMSYRELSARLADAGRRIPELGLSRLERGERRADADDLTALALALETTPNRLMLPEITAPGIGGTARLTAAAGGTPQQLWEWAQGERPISSPLEPLWDEPDTERRWQFLRNSKPYLLAPEVMGGGGIPGRELRDPSLDELGGVTLAIGAALEAGLSPVEVRCAVELAIWRSMLERET